MREPVKDPARLEHILLAIDRIFSFVDGRDLEDIQKDSMLYYAVVKNIEDEIVRNELVPLMEDFYVDELMYFTSDEFLNKVVVDGKIKSVDWDDLNKNYNSDAFSPVDGRTVRLADHLSAFIEADSSIKYGITSNHLTSGRDNIIKAYPSGNIINGIEIADLLQRIAVAK